MDLVLQAVYKGTGKGKCGLGKGQNWNEKGGKGGKDGGKNSWQKGSGNKGGKRARKGWQRRFQKHVGRAARQDTLQLGVEKVATNICTPLMNATVKTLKNKLTTKKICKHCACWRKARTNSVKR